MTPQLDDEIVKQTINEHLSSFHSAMLYSNPAEKVNTFLSSFSAFADTIRKHHDKLQQDTLVAVGGFFSAINSLATNILQLDKKLETLQQEATEELANLTLSDNEKSEGATEYNRCPAYVKPSMQWLLQNLHNPYPSKKIKKEISDQTKCSLKDIDAWFSDTRKRVGWNKLRKTHFSNKQEKIIAAATRIFRPKPTSFSTDLTTTLSDEVDSDSTYRADFLAVAKCARSLYADRFPELMLCGLDHAVHSTTPTKTSEEQHTSEVTPHHTEIVSFSYPTPEYSPSHPQESLPATPSDNDQIPLSPCRKRRNSSLDDSEDIQANDRTPKRRRHVVQDIRNPSTSSLPSPPYIVDSSIDSITDILSAVQSDQVSSSRNPENSTRKRKRRLSDGESGESRKRPHSGFSFPRLQTVSDPLPTTKLLSEDPFDQWIETDVAGEHLSDTIPSPASVGNEISLDNALDLHFHQYVLPPFLSDDNAERLFDSTNRVGILASPIDQKDSSVDFLSDDDGVDKQFPQVPPPIYQDDFHASIFAHNTFCQNPNILSSFSDDLIDLPSYFGIAHESNLSGTIPLTIDDLSVGINSITVPHEGLSMTQEQLVRRARAQALREELALYEAEGL